MADRYRVVQWGTGAVGMEGLERMIDHPQLELVGVKVYSDKKAGVDAGELVGRGPVGVVASQDVQSILDLRPDCICYAASDQMGANDYADDLCMILEAGINIVNVTMTKLAYPPMLPDVVERLDAACASGGASHYYGGINPGFATDLLPMLLTSGVNKIDKIDVTEHIDASTYLDAPLLQQGLGFGLTPEEDAKTLDAKLANADAAFTPSARLIAYTLGVAVDDIKIERTVSTTDEAFDVKQLHIAKGTINAFHIKIDFLVRGEPRITYNERVRVAHDVSAPWPKEWRAAPGGVGGYFVTIHGDPTIDVELSYQTLKSKRWSPGDGIGGALIFTCVRVVNAIPKVCEAPPGNYGPLSLGKDVFGTVDW